MGSRDQQRRDEARLISRVCGGYLLRSLKTFAALLDHDYGLTVVYLAILQANLGALEEDAELALRYAGLDETPPEALYRPISVHALAQALHMPYETTRRGVGRLIELGFVSRVSRNGVIALSARQAHPDCKQAIEADATDAGRMFAHLRRLGVDGVA